MLKSAQLLESATSTLLGSLIRIGFRNLIPNYFHMNILGAVFQIVNDLVCFKNIFDFIIILLSVTVYGLPISCTYILLTYQLSHTIFSYCIIQSSMHDC